MRYSANRVTGHKNVRITKKYLPITQVSAFSVISGKEECLKKESNGLKENILIKTIKQTKIVKSPTQKYLFTELL